MELLKRVIEQVPEVLPYLSVKTRFLLSRPEEYKTAEFMTAQIRRLVSSLYNGYIGGEFIDVMANVISGQLQDAYEQAWQDYGGDGELPLYLLQAYEEDVLKQYDFVDAYYRDIVDARIDGTPIDPLLVRADMWGNRWNDSYTRANQLIAEQNGGNLIWQYGEAEHCDTCRSLNGIVASAKEWGQAGVRPQNAPNRLIECGGWNCKCTLTPTKNRRSPKAFDRIIAIVGGV